MTMVQSRRISIQERYGIARRLDCTLDKQIEGVKRALRELTSLARTPSKNEFEALIVCHESVSNWYLHNPDGDLNYKLTVGPGVIEQRYEYACEKFDTCPVEPEGETSRGKGLRLIKLRCNKANYSFRSGRVDIRLLQRF